MIKATQAIISTIRRACFVCLYFSLKCRTLFYLKSDVVFLVAPYALIGGFWKGLIFVSVKPNLFTISEV